jgi:hypothetical protein
MGGEFRWDERKVVILSLFGDGCTTEVTIKIIHMLLLLLALQIWPAEQFSSRLLNPPPSYSNSESPFPDAHTHTHTHTHARHSHPLFYIHHILLHYLVLREMHCCHLPVWKVAKKIQESLRFTLAKHVSNINGEPLRRTKLPTSLPLHINLSPEQHLTDS